MTSSLFSGRVLLWNRCEFRLETERELRKALENKIILIYFGSWNCPKCREFAPKLRQFCRRLTDPFHVERAEQVGFVYVGRDESRQEQQEFLNSMPSRWMALQHGDDFGRELQRRFSVSAIPSVVVLKPTGELLVGNAVGEILDSGISCFRGWREAAELLDRNFLLPEDSEGFSRKSLTEVIRRRKYRVREEEEEEKREKKLEKWEKWEEE